MNEAYKRMDKEYKSADDELENEGRQVQAELERQLREFGKTMTDAAAAGFDGCGEDIGDAALGVGRAAVDMANYAIGQAAAAMRDGVNEDKIREKFEEKEKRLREKRQKYKSGYAAKGATEWAKAAFGAGSDTPEAEMRRSAQKRFGSGLALMIVGGIFAFSFAIGGIAVLASMPFAADVANTALVTVVDGVEQEMVLTSGELVATAGDFLTDFGSAAYTAMGITGSLLGFIAAGFGYMMWAGWQRIKAGRWLRRCADTVHGLPNAEAEGVSLGLLKDAPAQKTRKILKRVRKYIRKGWLTAWLDEQESKIYLNAESYRAAQASESEPEPQPQQAEEQKEPLNLETARRFARVLEQERAVMRDERAAEELEHMQKTAEAICTWLDSHPESLPKARRFAEYYIPTTLKLLHTYNDVQGQQGENAENIRRDIAGILHTLNQAYDNLYNTLLSDMALDVSGEIAALQGMLANDGLAGEAL